MLPSAVMRVDFIGKHSATSRIAANTPIIRLHIMAFGYICKKNKTFNKKVVEGERFLSELCDKRNHSKYIFGIDRSKRTVQTQISLIKV